MNTDKYKQLLEEEKVLLETGLSKLGKKVKNSDDEWDATEATESEIGEDLSEPTAEEGDAAEQIEGYEERVSEERTLEIRYREVCTALQKIDSGDFGMCKEGGAPHPIEEERLGANPAAATCMSHMQ